MAILRVYAFSKRNNSTKRPTGIAYTDHNVTLKGGCDLLAPIFTLYYNRVPNDFNYALFEGRYYFVSGYKNVRDNLWEISCNVDVLASWDSIITASSQYVLYYTHTNTEIADKRLSIKASQLTEVQTGSFGFLGKNHCFILTAIGVNATASYALTPSQIQHLYASDYRDSFDASINALAPVTGSGFADTLSDFARWIGDFLKSAAGAFNYAGTISDNIKSCVILPVAAGAIGGTPNVDVYLGAINTLVDGFKITDRTFEDTASVTIPWRASDWRRLEPYHEIYLYIPALGMIQLSPSDLIGESTLGVHVSMDVLSGDAIFEVGTSTKRIYYAATNLGTPYALGSSQTSPASVVNSMIGAAAMASGNPAAMLGGALGIANSLKPHPTCVGSNAGGAILGVEADKIYCISVYHDTAVSPANVSAVKGTPYNGVMSLSGISGYVQTDGASVDGAMTDTERDMINKFLDGGIYIE